MFKSSLNPPDCVLITPPYSLQQNFNLLDFVGSYGPPLNLLYLAGSLEKNGFSVEIADFTHDTRSLLECASDIIASGVLFVGVTVHFTFLVPTALELIALIKKGNPAVKIVVGGVHFTALPDETMNECPEIDIGVIGEGEETIIDIMNYFIKETSLYEIQGIIFRMNEQLVKTGQRPAIKNLDDIPFLDYSKIDLSLYYPPMHQERKTRNFMIATSRGCPFQCAFCDRTVLGKSVRNYSAKYISEMIDDLIAKYNAECLLLEDENFCIKDDRFREICELLKEKHLKCGVTWSCCLRADSVKSWMGAILYDSGCRAAFFGIESGSQQMLNTYNKRLNINILPEKCKIIRDAGIKLSGSFIVGGPGECRETVNATVKLLWHKIELDYMYLWYFMPYPGSAIYNNLASGGAILGDYSQCSGHKIAFVPASMTYDELESSYKRIYRTFYSKPSVILRVVMSYGIPRLHTLFYSGFKYLWRFVIKR